MNLNLTIKKGTWFRLHTMEEPRLKSYRFIRENVIFSEQDANSITLIGDVIHIGWAPANHVVLDDKRAGDFACTLLHKSKWFGMRDWWEIVGRTATAPVLKRGSKYVVPSAKLEATPLQDGDIIVLGNTHLTVKLA